MVFRNRTEAGRMLAEELTGTVEKDALLLAIPRGGVVVAAEMARLLELSIDLIIPRKIGAPHNPEAAVGAVTQDGTAIFDHRLIELLDIENGELDEMVSREVAEIKRRMDAYGAGRYMGKSSGRQLIVVDDGVATGYTMQAALRSARSYKPKELVLATPVAPPDTLEHLKKEVDRAVCLMAPADFYAVGQFYENFEQVKDSEVIKILRHYQDGKFFKGE